MLLQECQLCFFRSSMELFILARGKLILCCICSFSSNFLQHSYMCKKYDFFLFFPWISIACQLGDQQSNTFQNIYFNFRYIYIAKQLIWLVKLPWHLNVVICSVLMFDCLASQQSDKKINLNKEMKEKNGLKFVHASPPPPAPPCPFSFNCQTTQAW